MKEITDLAQMKAVAETAKSYTLDKASRTVSTIIDTLEEYSGGGAVVV